MNENDLRRAAERCRVLFPTLARHIDQGLALLRDATSDTFGLRFADGVAVPGATGMCWCSEARYGGCAHEAAYRIYQQAEATPTPAPPAIHGPVI